MEDEENGFEESPCVLLAVDRAAAPHQYAADVAATLAAALKRNVVAVEVRGAGDAAETTPHATAATILGAAERLRPAVIVLPSPVRSPLSSLLAGSVGYDLVRRAPCPVLLVRLGPGEPQSAEGLLTRIVLAVDASTAPKRAVSTILRVAEPGAEVIVLHVHEVDRTETYAVDHRIGSVAAELEAAGFRVGVIQSHALPHAVADDIAEVARELGAGMIVVGSGGGSLLASLTHGGMSGDVLRRAPCPVLVEH